MNTQEIINTIIAKYEKKKDFRSRPVLNFLGSLGSSTRWDAMQNLHADAKCYKWKACIVSAIRDGINKILPR